MKHKGRTYLILTIVLAMFLIPIIAILTRIEELKGTMGAWIIIAIVFGLTFIYYLVMTYIIFHRGKKK